MVRDELSVLSAFLAVAEERSFTRAAQQLGVSPSALSHALRGLEERLGVRLLARATRSVAPTEAGAPFLARIRPALADVRGALDQVTGLREQPAGRVRVVASRLAARMLLAPSWRNLPGRFRTWSWRSRQPRRAVSTSSAPAGDATITEGAAQSGDAHVRIRIDANAGAARSAILIIAGGRFTLTQEACRR
jgi:hypothetical protein